MGLALASHIMYNLFGPHTIPYPKISFHKVLSIRIHLSSLASGGGGSGGVWTSGLAAAAARASGTGGGAGPIWPTADLEQV